MNRKVLISTVLFLFSLGLAYSQDAKVEDLYWFSDGDGISVEFELYWKPITVGSPYVETQIGRDGFTVYGYTYEGVNYKNSDLSEYGITFPYSSKGYAEISASASIESGSVCGFESIDLNSRSVHIPVKTTYDLDEFSSIIKGCLDEYRKEEGVSWEAFLDFYNIEVEHVYIEASSQIENAIRRKIAKEEKEDELEGKRDELWNIYENVCFKNYDDYETLRKNMTRFREVTSNKELLADWQKESVDKCSAKLSKRSEELLFNDEDEEEEVTTRSLFNAAINRAEAAEANGDYYTAADEYRAAYALDSQYWLQNKIREMKQRAETQAIAAGTATFISGMNEEFADLPKGRLDGSFVFSVNYSNLNYGGTNGLGGMEGASLGGYASIDRIFWFDKYKQVGAHLGAVGSQSALWDNFEGNNSFTNGYSSQPNNLDIGFFLGLNAFGKIELDYYFRGLSIKGEYSAEAPNSSQGRLDQPIGGPLHFDGGARASFYLYNNKEFFIRGTGWYVDGFSDSPLKFLDNANNDEVQTVSYGYRIVIAKRPWSLVIFSQHDAYHTNEALNVGLNSWGIGLGLGLGN
ncbi:MAG: hypothetical protein ABJK11_17605 [Balneola sp.]